MLSERAAVGSSPDARAIKRWRDNLSLVLIIDDDPQVAHATRFILNRSGFYAMTAATAEEGLELAIELCPNVIICDATLPRVNGCQLLHLLKQTENIATIPVIVTGSFEGLDSEGMFTFLRKPFDTATLVGATRNALPQRLRAA